MILLIDNYDSFTYNLVHYFQCLQQDIVVHYHDQITINDIKNLGPSAIVISPGPNSPDKAGISLEVIQHFYSSLPMLGICLGHQCLAQAFGAKITQTPKIMHGKTSKILHNKRHLFNNLPNRFSATRYHSLAIEVSTLSAEFAIDAWSEDGIIMGISHRIYPLFGVQFHPEAILTEHGYTLLKNFLNYMT